MLVHHDMGYNIACARHQVGISINREPFDSQMHNKLLSEIRLELPPFHQKKMPHSCVVTWLTIDLHAVEKISSILDKVTCTRYTTVRPVLSSSVPETQSSVPNVGTGHENSNYDAQQHSQVTVLAAACTFPAVVASMLSLWAVAAL